MTKALIKGNEAVVHGALAAGVRCYFGYPITPQNEIPELMSKILPANGGSFVPAESEIGAINMLHGAAACGTRAMVSSSSPGISLMQEGISYMAGSELPGVIVDMVRGGPGLGDIGPSQADYFQATRGGGHGDYRTPVLAPSTCQECYDMTIEAFEWAFKYRTPVLVLGDAMVGQMKEPVTYQAPAENLDSFFKKDASSSWCLEGYGSREPRLLKSVWLNDNYLSTRIEMLQKKYQSMQDEARAFSLYIDDADLIVIAYGSMGRIAHAAVEKLKEQGKRVGFIRPQTLYPFPTKILQDLTTKAKAVLVIEQNTGQMIEDVRLALQGRIPIMWHGVMPGCFPSEDNVMPAILKNLS